MTIGSVTGTNAGASSSASSRAGIADNFDTFLNILTTQLKNQNPLDPLDTNQFTQQLVQFSGVEQQLKTNDFLQSLILNSQASTATQATSFIGKTVTASTTVSELANGSASWSLNVDKDAGNSSIVIKDASGAEVYRTKGALTAGENTFTWDGVGSNGKSYPSGSYQISVDGRDTDGNYVPVTTEMSGKVDSVDFTGSEPFLMIGGAHISLSSVKTVKA